MQGLFKTWSSTAMLAAAIAMMAGCMSQSGEEFDVALADFPLSFTGQWVYDAGTICMVGGSTMHCCPDGYAMVGAHVGDNVFKCAQLSSTFGFAFLDVATQRNGMHACPYGSVMVGLHVGQNHLACQWPGASVVSEYVDGNTQDAYPMHVCTGGEYAMSGIHAGDNRFTCAR